MTGENSMDVQVGDSIITKKTASLRQQLFAVLRVGMVSVSAVPNADGRSWCRAAKLKKTSKNGARGFAALAALSFAVQKQF